MHTFHMSHMCTTRCTFFHVSQCVQTKVVHFHGSRICIDMDMCCTCYHVSKTQNFGMFGQIAHAQWWFVLKGLSHRFWTTCLTANQTYALPCVTLPNANTRHHVSGYQMHTSPCVITKSCVAHDPTCQTHLYNKEYAASLENFCTDISLLHHLLTVNWILWRKDFPPLLPHFSRTLPMGKGR